MKGIGVVYIIILVVLIASFSFPFPITISISIAVTYTGFPLAADMMMNVPSYVPCSPSFPVFPKLHEDDYGVFVCQAFPARQACGTPRNGEETAGECREGS